jgi:phosphatidate phosphatase APP1
MNKSKANGHFSGIVHLTQEQISRSRNAQAGGRIEFEALTKDGRVFKGSAELMDDDGISVISDIDDTIKITEVLRRHECLRHTFLEPFKPVPGMAEAYQVWAGKPGVLFHYVSASPWQLYFPLTEFVRSNGFPEGVFELKTFRLKDRTFMSLFESPEIYKLQTIEPMFKQYPRRHFVLVGDSGERDPEAYATLARRYPAQVSHIFIRNITGEGPDAPRFQKDFAGLPDTQWTVFKDPQALRAWWMSIRTEEPSDQK